MTGKFALAALTVALSATSGLAQSLMGRNLIVNGDAEDGTGISTAAATKPLPPKGWTVKGNLTLAQYGATDLLSTEEPFAPPNSGKNYFSGGPGGAASSAAQTIDLSAEAAAIDGGSALFSLSGFIGQAWRARADLKATFKDGTGKSLLVTKLDTVPWEMKGGMDGMLYRITRGQLPAGTRSVDIQLDMIPDNQAYNMAEADDLSLVLSNGKLWGVNLIENGTAESGRVADDGSIVRPVVGWNAIGEFSPILYGVDSWEFLPKDTPGPVDRGLRYFWGGASQLSTGYQWFDVSGASTTVDTGLLTYNVGAYLGMSPDYPCKASIRLRLLDKEGNPLVDRTLTVNRGRTGLYPVNDSGPVPAGTRRIELNVVFDINEGIGQNYAFADNISLVLVNPIATVVIKDRGIVNAASGQYGAIAPGEIISIFGEGLGPAKGIGMETDMNGKLLTSRGGVSVLINSVPAPIYLTQAGQINAQVPLELTGASTTVSIDNNGSKSASTTIDVTGAAPGVFTLDGSGKGQAWILNKDLTANGTTNAAQAGDLITIFCTGLGAMDGGATGQMLTGGSVPKAKATVTAKIGGQTADVSFAGAVPYGWPGVYQVLAKVPSGLTAGPQPVVVSAGSAASAAGVSVTVK